MTTRLNLHRLSEIARVTADPDLPVQRPPVVLRWTIDTATGRPVGRWILGDGPVTSVSEPG
jgi:hypothetical protein